MPSIDTPVISVIVLNYNGIGHLQSCLPSLEKLDYPADKLELIVVDNNSKDGSLDFVRTSHPRVRTVALPDNRGFAAGNNAGARAATGEYVVFLNNDMWVDPQLLNGFISAMRAFPAACCVAAKILNWDGSKFDFVGSSAHFAGYAYQEGLGEPFNPEKYTRARQILFACGGAMLIDRVIFLDCGGFDEDYFIYYEDLDLGWRLWVLGHEVVYAPGAVVYHRHHGTMDGFSNYRKQVLFKTNALRTVLKNYGDAALGRVLPAAILGAIDGIVSAAERDGAIQLADFEIKSRQKPKQFSGPFNKLNLASLIALRNVAQTASSTLAKRKLVQYKRARSDEDVARMLAKPFLYWPDVSPATQYRLIDAFDLQPIFAKAARNVLVISSDILPYAGLPTVGSGLRAWGLGQGLTASGHSVTFSMPRAALAKVSADVPDEVKARAWEPHTIHAIIRDTQPDVIVVCNWPIMGLLQRELINVPVILDQHGPHLLERQYQNFGDQSDNARQKLAALAKADRFTCAGAKQLGYFQSWLTKAGWTDAERADSAASFPVSLDPRMPVRDYAMSDGPVFVYGGVFLPWQDPSIGLDALVRALAARDSGRLMFFGGKHPVYPVDPGKYDQILAAISGNARVSAPGMVPHDTLIENYTRAHVALDLMQRNPERELAFTTRTVEYLWCGLPVIYNDYSELSDLIREYDAGWIVDPADKAATERVIADIFDHPEQIAAKGRNAQRLVSEKLNWEVTGAAIDRFVRMPRMRQHAAEPLSSIMLRTRTLRYLAGEARRHYKLHGARGLWREGTAFLKRQSR